MSEHAYFNGRRVKIGTCEEMLYLRADQAHLVQLDDQESNPTDPLREWNDLLFRFPWPDEDDTEPGGFEDSSRSLVIPAELLSFPQGLRHEQAQFVSAYRPGYLMLTLCPELVIANRIEGMAVTRQTGGAVGLVYQRVLEGPGGLALVPVLQCVGCRSTYRLPSIDDGMELVVAIRSMADRAARPDGAGPERAAFLHSVADRVMAGYANPKLVEHFIQEGASS